MPYLWHAFVAYISCYIWTYFFVHITYLFSNSVIYSSFLRDYCQQKGKKAMDFLYICCYICAYISCYIYPYIYTCCLFILYIPFPVLSCSSLLTDYCQPKEIRGGGFLWRNLFGILYIHTNNHAFFVCLFFIFVHNICRIVHCAFLRDYCRPTKGKEEADFWGVI